MTWLWILGGGALVVAAALVALFMVARAWLRQWADEEADED